MATLTFSTFFNSVFKNLGCFTKFFSFLSKFWSNIDFVLIGLLGEGSKQNSSHRSNLVLFFPFPQQEC